MLTVSLHGIQIHAPIGLYPEERISGNDFEIDVDIFMRVDANEALPFVDYAIIEKVVSAVFKMELHTLEALALQVYIDLKAKVQEAEKIRVCIRKMNPPLPGKVKYSQVVYEV